MAGRLQDPKMEGADQSYDGAYSSDFEKKIQNAKGSSTFNAKSERFKVQQQAPEVDVHQRGLSDLVQGKPQSTWESHKPRFKEPEPDNSNYNTTVSSFTTATKNQPSPMMRLPEKDKDRSAKWMTNSDQVESPDPTNLPGAFNIKNTPSPMSNSGGQRFKGLNQVVSYGDPSSSPFQSDFEKSLAKNKPSPNMVAKSDRFKNDVPSYGDPGNNASTSDIEKQKLEEKIARQKAQKEAERERVLQKGDDRFT